MVEEVDDISLTEGLEKLTCSYSTHPMQETCCHSHWDGEVHYVVHDCNCGSKSWMKIDLLGFDSVRVFQKNRVVVESNLRKVFES